MSNATYQDVRKEEKIQEKSKATFALQWIVSDVIGSCHYYTNIHLLQFHVVDKNVKSLLGLPDCLKINLISFKEEVHGIKLGMSWAPSP